MGRYSTVIADVLARLAYQTVADQSPPRILAGFKYEPIPRVHLEGWTDLPGIAVFIPSAAGQFRPARLTQGTIKIMIAVAVKKDDGMTALFEAMEKVIDALQTKPDGTDAAAVLNGTMKHFDWSMSENFVVDLSITGQITINAEPRPGDLARNRN